MEDSKDKHSTGLEDLLLRSSNEHNITCVALRQALIFYVLNQRLLLIMYTQRTKAMDGYFNILLMTALEVPAKKAMTAFEVKTT